MKKFIGVKLIKGEPMTLGEYNKTRGWTIPPDEDPEREGYFVKYKDGYISWSPKEIFDEQNILVVGDNNKVHPQDVSNMISHVFVSTITPPGTKSKTTLVQCVLVNGFVITESSACVDPANYDEIIGSEICMEKIKDKIWFLMGFLMQSAVFGFQPDTVPATAEKKDDLPDGPGPVGECGRGSSERLFCRRDGIVIAESISECEKICGGKILTPAWSGQKTMDVKPPRHVVDALNRMDSDLKEFINIDNKEDIPGIPARVKFIIQSDPVSEVGVNGCQAQDIIEYSLCLIQSLNDRFPCRENALTITKLEEALFWQEKRTKARFKAGVEGYNKSVPAEG